MFARSDNTTLVSVVVPDDGIPSFYVTDDKFNLIAPRELATPGGLFAESSDSQINLSWWDVSGDNGYIVERRNDTEGDWEQVGSTTISSTVYADGYVTPQEKYFYRVFAVFGEDKSGPTTEEVAVTFDP
jgi:hypothetical protein